MDDEKIIPLWEGLEKAVNEYWGEHNDKERNNPLQGSITKIVHRGHETIFHGRDTLPNTRQAIYKKPRS
jgi:hypothetical protein